MRVRSYGSLVRFARAKKFSVQPSFLPYYLIVVFRGPACNPSSLGAHDFHESFGDVRLSPSENNHHDRLARCCKTKFSIFVWYLLDILVCHHQ